ncbi:MAG: hypothetical protein M1822_005191 [Bathelium mastoideum]|nr:MAG: hypothetical protein M1822_005191 [Bathelium mastoideum]
MTSHLEASVRHHPQTSIATLDPDSHTAQRLVRSNALSKQQAIDTLEQRHSTPEHLHLTTRRCFIGPIPEGWLKSHRRDWYKHQLGLSESSRQPSFRASGNVSKQRRLTGLDGPSATAVYGHSFKQPNALELAEEDEAEEGQAGLHKATTESPPAIGVSRSSPHPPPGIEEGTTSLRPRKEETTYEDARTTQSPDGPTGENNIKPQIEGSKSRRESEAPSFRTAAEQLPSQRQKSNETDPAPRPLSTVQETSNVGTGSASKSSGDSASGALRSGSEDQPGAATSTTSLVRHGNHNDITAKDRPGSSAKPPTHNESDAPAEAQMAEPSAPKKSRRKTLGAVRFNVSDQLAKNELQMKAKLAQLSRQRTIRNLRTSTRQEGQIMKMERMLVRIDWSQQQLPREYDENCSQKIERRTLDKWRELMVVCRATVSGEEASFKLQMYKTRVIPALEQEHVRKRPLYEIPLDPKSTGVNLYSSLDKTVVMWKSERKGTRIFIMQPQSGADSMEWYTFIRNIGGWYRNDTLQVIVPDLSVQLILANPFEKIEASRDIAQAADGDETAIAKTLEEEQAIAGNIVERCVNMLEKSPQWRDIVQSWTHHHQVGLAWKRYDRLEWVHGANERKMYGTIAMQQSHDLELRPKQHYSTSVRNTAGQAIKEPPPIEGFLIRLTSLKGRDQKLGRMFFKRLYFSTHNQFLTFSRPAKVQPPPPPKLPMRTGTKIPTAHEIADQTPLIYAVDPYDLNQDGKVAWLASESGRPSDDVCQRDQEALDEAERSTDTLRNCDGIVKLSSIIRVRNVIRGATPADDHVDSGSDVEFHQEVDDSPNDDGTTGQFDDARTFELVLRNGLIIRLQAYNQATKTEWMQRLRHLVRYWTLRVAADLDLYKQVRRTNFATLKIDEESEAFVGQFAKKWEVGQATASPALYHLCGIARCRTVLMAGTLYRKPRRHAVFARCTVILCPGRLLLFQDTPRTRSGHETQHIHHERIGAIELQGCYLYSGLATENDLLYQNRTFDANRPGRHALPRRYGDGWTSCDEDTATCFVVWHGRKKNLFRTPGDQGSGGDQKPGERFEQRRQRLKLVSSLGVPGRSIVFKTRSRAEKDHWVMSIAGEIERLQAEEDVRLLGK